MTQAMGTLVQWGESKLRWTKSGMIGVHFQCQKFEFDGKNFFQSIQQCIKKGGQGIFLAKK